MGQNRWWSDEEKFKLRTLINVGATDDNTLTKHFPSRPLAGINKMIWQLKGEDKAKALDYLVSADARARIVKNQGHLSHKLALMTGLKKAHMSLRHREHIADMVMGVERWLQETPMVELVGGSSNKEAAVLLVSDLHSGKHSYDEHGNPTYSKDFAAHRLAVLKKKVIHLIRKNLRPDKIDEFHILLLGDIVDGSGIYVGQELNQDMQAVQPQVSLAAAGIWDIARTVRRELAYPVFIRGIRGNHGKQGKYAPAENNFDFMVYQTLKMLAHYEDREGVSVEYSTTTDYLNFVIKERRAT